MRIPTSLIAVAIFCMALCQPASAATYTVTTTSDSGAGSLRQAIIDANANSGLDEIHFNIAGSGVRNIALSSTLPGVTSPVLIDGYTQPGSSVSTSTLNSNAVILIDIHPLTAGGTSGLSFLNGSAGSTVRGLAFNRFASSQLNFTMNAGNCVVIGNFIGLAADGDTMYPSTSGTRTGITVGGAGCRVGGSAAAERNVISGNSNGGIYVSADNVEISGNIIGADKSGGAARPNSTGIALGNMAARPQNTLIGAGNTTRNVISGNSRWGIEIRSADHARIHVNTIGRTAFPIFPLANELGGILVSDGTDILIAPTVAVAGGAGNSIGSNGGPGVLVNGAGTTASIYGNLIWDNAGLPIDLAIFGENGLDPIDNLDADEGPNGLQNRPVITDRDNGGTTTVVHGSLHSTPSSQFYLDFYGATTCSPDGHANATEYLGYVTTITDASGNASWTYNHSSLLTDGYVTATASTSGSVPLTSEFALCLPLAETAVFADGFESP